MPPINPVATAGVIAISVAVVAAIAVYESPEIRRIADDLRRRIAVAVQALGDNISPDDTEERRRQREASGQPLFNRPEDAEGFMVSSGRRSNADPGVVADEESRRRQREELLYWNRMQMQRKKEEEQQQRGISTHTNNNQATRTEKSWQPREALEAMQRATQQAAAAAGIYIPSLGSGSQPQQSNTTFDEFLRPDHGADQGTFVVNTGADTTGSLETDPLNGGLLRRRRNEGVRGLNSAMYANPFGDEYGIELDDHQAMASSSPSAAGVPSVAEALDSKTAYIIGPDRDETFSDIYSATEPDISSPVTGPASTNGNNNSINNDSVFDPLPTIPEAARSSRSAQAVSEVPTSEVFFDVNDYTSPQTISRGDAASELSLRLQRALAQNDEYVTASQARSHEEDNNGESTEEVNTEAFNSIQAWAQNSSSGFYSPLPVTPSVAMSEPSVVSVGELTPTESLSMWGDDHSVVNHEEAATNNSDNSCTVEETPVPVSAPISAPVSVTASVAASDYGVVSEDEDGASVMTPTSWSEVGSVVSENDANMHA